MSFKPGDFLRRLTHKDDPGVPGLPAESVPEKEQEHIFGSFAEYIRDILNVCGTIKHRYENDADPARRLIAVSAETLRTALLNPGGMEQFVQEMRLSFLQVLAAELGKYGRKVELKSMVPEGMVGLDFGLYRNGNGYRKLLISESGRVDVRWAFEREGVH